MVLDLAENYPAMLRARWEAHRARPTDLLVRNPMAARWVEECVLLRSDAVMVVVDESRDRLRGLGVPSERIAVVGNTPPLARLEGPRADRGTGDGPLEIVYLGLLEALRGIGTLLEAVALLTNQGCPVRLTAYGDGLEGSLFRAQG